MSQIEVLEKRLASVNKELEGCRTTSYVDGWQTMRHAKKARKWDVLAQQKRHLIDQIDDLKNESRCAGS